MSNAVYRASSAGSLMLMGEHAVLRNKPALVMAIDKRVIVSILPREDHKIIIQSKLGELTLTLDTLKQVAPFQFVLAAIQHYKKNLKTGFVLNIESEFSDKVGLGSSAAVLVATLAALGRMLENKETSNEVLFTLAKKIMLQVQGLGSGADIAASIYGGVVLYQQVPQKIEKISVLPPVVVIYSGSKTPTVDVIKDVEDRRKKEKILFNKIDESIGAYVDTGLQALKQENWSLLGNAMNMQQAYMVKLGVSNQALDDLVNLLQAQSTIHGAKISGAGLGDCVIGLGEFNEVGHYVKAPQNVISVSASLQGLLYDQ